MQDIQRREPFILERRGCPLHYWITGANKGPWVVFCHGARMNHHTFDEQIHALEKDYRLLLIDLRGHGQSRPMGEDFSIDFAANDVLDIMDQCQIKKAVVVGHSMGGLIAQTIARKDPDRIFGLVIAGSIRLTIKLPPFTGIIRKTLKTIVNLTPNSLAIFSFGRGAGTKKRTKQTAYMASQMVPKKDFKMIIWGILNGIKSDPGYQLPCPVLVVQSDKDFVGFGLLRILSYFWIRHEAQCRYALIPNARHNMMQDQPEDFNQHLSNFLLSLFN